ncbi:MAG: hypothetical protein M1812_006185 [Candelaria pacifica]|nr:MAG: hypothetical protein M1812_006185 [Candelaria pacifica]
MAAPGRSNQYFIPGEGIIREVIQADICRYLGNDALVRPGAYQGREGFFITAYRNLTSEMISDLKIDSQRWAVERQEGEARGYRGTQSRSLDLIGNSNLSPVAYPSSTTHQSRQHWGPTATTGPPPGQAGAVYAPSSAPQSNPYDQGGYTYGQPAGGYPPQGTQYGYPVDQYGAQTQPRAGPYGYPAPDGQDRGVPGRDQDPGYGYSPGGQQVQAPRSGVPQQQQQQQQGSRAQQQVPASSRSTQPQPPVARPNQQYQPRYVDTPENYWLEDSFARQGSLPRPWWLQLAG